MRRRDANRDLPLAGNALAWLARSLLWCGCSGRPIVTRSPKHALFALTAIVILSVALAGCGRKSGLDAPPAAAIGNAQAPGQGGSDPAYGPDGKPIAPQGAKRSTPLDWLLN
jgi:predicted small lipoprotein YifL